MKNPALLTIVILLPFLIQGQSSNLPNVNVRKTDGSVIDASGIIRPGEPTLLVYWQEGDKDIYDQIETIREMIIDRTLPKMRIVAICNVTTGTYGNITAEVSGNDLDADIFLDINGELHQAMELPQASSFVLYDHYGSFLARYIGACSCVASLADPEVGALLAITDKQHDYEASPYNY